MQAGVERFPTSRCTVATRFCRSRACRWCFGYRRDLASGKERTAESDWLWGCDGARSLTRKTLGIELEDLEFDQPWLVVDTMLKRDVDLPEVAIQLCDPARPTTFIPSGGRHRRWEFMLMPGETAEELEREETVWRLLEPWVTREDTEVVRAVVYSFHALIAKEYRGGRAFILGDAAHQMPPFLGQGVRGNTRRGEPVVEARPRPPGLATTRC